SQGDNVARVAAIRAGLPVSVAGLTVNRFCSSGLQAIAVAARQIMHDGSEAALAGGVESITATANIKRDPNPWVREHKPGVYMVRGQRAGARRNRQKNRRQPQGGAPPPGPAGEGGGEGGGFFPGGVAPEGGRPRHPQKEAGQGGGKESPPHRRGGVNPPRH